MKKILACTLLFLVGVQGLFSQNRQKETSPTVIMDMVHHNPGEAFTKTQFNDPSTLADYHFNAQVINEFQSVHCAVTYESLNPAIFPAGSLERKWVDSLATRIDRKIEEIHKHHLKAYYFTDIIVLPKKLVEIYKDEICDATGRVDFRRPKTQEIHRIMLREIFDRFPALDGLVIRVGETYLHNIPYHTGNNPIPRDEKSWDHNFSYKSDGGEKIHRDLINLLRDEVCVKYNKKLFYRTWDFGYFHTNPEYYLNVTDYVPTHPNLYFCIKYIQGDYHRTYKFNPTLGIGQHKQVVEIQCQREYEGKGAYPNYIADGLINGFEELKKDTVVHSLRQLKETPNYAGIWTWSRGGGWVGPYISNELWCDVNTFVLAEWANHPELDEKEIFARYAASKGFQGEDIERFHRICLLSADAIVRGRASLVQPINVWWTRDQFIGGEKELEKDFRQIVEKKLVDAVLAEKAESVKIWEQINAIAGAIGSGDKPVADYIRTSSQYGLLLYSIYEQGWIILLKGYEGEMTGHFNKPLIRKAIKRYDKLWKDYRKLKETKANCATLYLPYGFNFSLPPAYHDENGIKKTVDKYRNL